ncbi:MAG: TIGR03905 family TSCPD domain-containing protein [Oscillospiraceae bacterium]|jgi:uncharacterized protein (TIGR03905 family)|nr:TIGR03905 family TSCPD domain-containing protein [Oscillospiraceae bacterium]
MLINYKTQGVCPDQINIEVQNGIVKEVQFRGGCNGNSKGVAELVKGMKVQDVISKLEDIRCGSRATSCPAQLAKALKENI